MEEVQDLLSGAGDAVASKPLLNLSLAKQEVEKMLSATGSSISSLCSNIEEARTRDEVKIAFTSFNTVMRMFLEAAPRAEHDRHVRDALCSVDLSRRLRFFMESAPSVQEALAQYKTRVVTEVAELIRAQASFTALDDDKDDELLLRLLPEPTSPFSDEGLQGDVTTLSRSVKGGLSRKRRFSATDTRPSAPLMSSIPALASVSRMQDLIDHGCASKKQALLTREKLRAGTHDPRGLLRMVSSSTNALERAKKLEILKNAGFVFNENKRSQEKISFSDRLTMATTRLEL